MAQDQSGLENIVVRPVYLRAVNAIVQPEQQIPCSVYFYRKWLPRLGALRWCMVLTLRSVCTQRQPDGTNRGEICRADLAALLGVHEATISRLLPTAPSTIHRGWRTLQPSGEKDLETTYLSKFIPRLRYKYERDVEAGVTRRVGYVIDVVIDDPLIPEDEEHLAVILAEQVLQGTAYATPVKDDAASARRGDAQSASSSTDKPGGARQQRRRQVTTPDDVKEQEVTSLSYVKAQSAMNTADVLARRASTRTRVNQQKAPSDAVSAQREPVLTLTNSYSYRDMSIDLTLTGKHAIRRAVAPLVQFAVNCLNDDHSTGMFYSTLAQLYPRHLDLFTWAVEAAASEGEMASGVNMGAVFVRSIKEFAAMRGVPFRLGKSAHVSDEPAPATNECEVDGTEPMQEAPEMSTAPETSTRKGAERAAYVKDSGVSIRQLWPSVLADLRGRTTKANYEMWLRHCSIVRADRGMVVVGAPSPFARDWVNERLLGVIKRALSEVLGKEVDVICEVQKGK